jgi:transaldolase
MALNAAQRLIEYGQSAWYDNISRDILFNGELKRLIKDCGIRGLTSNPTIFDNALKTGDVYDGQILSLRSKKLSTDQVFEELALQDIGTAADLLLPVWRESKGIDGYVSIEVSPLLARDAKGTVEAARHLFGRLSRPNVMIKIPGTPEGLPAVKSALENGINVNVTLLFSVDNYVQVAKTYCEALRARLGRGEKVGAVRSVASFFVSRVDTIVDSELEALIKKNETGSPATASLAKSLIGKFGVANSKLAYKRYQEIFLGEQFADLRKAGAQVQRPLWASTSTKNPSYRDLIYVEELIGRDTVNTLPHKTLGALIDHGVLAETLTKDLAQAESVVKQLTELGLNLNALMTKLQEEGVDKFADSFRALNTTLEKKLAQL